MKLVQGLVLAALFVAPEAQAKLSGFDFKAAMANVATAKFIFQSGLFNQIFAKELCSCLYVDLQTFGDCQAKDNLPSVAHKVVTITPNAAEKTVTSKFNLVAKTVAGALVKLGPAATAKYVSPQFGCVLTTPAPAMIP